MATVTSESEIEAIRRHMAQIRRELHEDVQGVVVGAEEATDWRHYVRRYPWAALGLAFAIGYLIVPKKHKAAAAEPEEQPGPRRKGRQEATVNKVVKRERKAGLIGTLFGMIAPIVMRAGQSYASQYLENWIAQQGVLGPGAGALGPRQPQSPPRPGPTRGGPGGPGVSGGPGMPGGPRRA